MRCAISMRMMRVSYPSGTTELRDALSHDWLNFFAAAPVPLTCIPVLNMGVSVEFYLQTMDIAAIILSGGDDFGLFPKRDETEWAMLKYAIGHNLPVLGICRGAQLINRFFGGTDAPMRGHTANHHEAKFAPELVPEPISQIQEVNSFHNRCLEKMGKELIPLVFAHDGTVEAYRHSHFPIMAVMWHPERESVLSDVDRVIVNKIFGDLP